MIYPIQRVNKTQKTSYIECSKIDIRYYNPWLSSLAQRRLQFIIICKALLSAHLTFISRSACLILIKLGPNPSAIIKKNRVFHTYFSFLVVQMRAFLWNNIINFYDDFSLYAYTVQILTTLVTKQLGVMWINICSMDDSAFSNRKICNKEQMHLHGKSSTLSLFQPQLAERN